MSVKKEQMCKYTESVDCVKGMVHLIYKSHIKAVFLCAKYNEASFLGSQAYFLGSQAYFQGTERSQNG